MRVLRVPVRPLEVPVNSPKPPRADELLEIAMELRTWSESAEGRTELASMMDMVRQAKAEASKDRQIDPKDLHAPVTL